ncbi:hypothetical protein QNI19_17140 [Cytophagaceae bacterium DM2B3-1]|uniref:ATP-grasp fold RimK-type domain-containing protein n=1 Tax=Xanthocytophaga flava TaxID=3048013 RepID=A0ABT7CLQ2_9BACT|nr:hypothetical protein [Xanthocytophaga flavus]MDJ1494674.1 hypothetical protein [Xanthocytophaga flavus]
MLSPKPRLLLVGLEPLEVTAITSQLDCLTVVYEHLPLSKLVDGNLYVESRLHSGTFLKVDKVIYHGIFENDFDFLTLLALWNGPCLPDAGGMMDCRLRHSGLVRALHVTKFGDLPRGMSLTSGEWHARQPTVAKWSNWHCGENKARIQDTWTSPNEITVYEPFIEGEAVRIMLIGDKVWQIHLKGEDWLKSIHHPDAAQMPVDADLEEDAKRLANYFHFQIVGIDYMIGLDGKKYLLEVNHIPNVTVFPFVREAFIDFAIQWVKQ